MKNEKKKGGRGPIKFKDICEDATELKIDRTHLYRVLVGERNCPDLVARYNAIRQRKAGAP